jgi:hypothetical protein
MCVGKFKLPVLVGATLAATWIGAGWCDDLPFLPAPVGFVESSALVPGIKEQSTIGQPPATHLIGVYLLPDELAQRMRGVEVPLTVSCRAYVIDSRSTEETARAAFKQLVAGMKHDTKNGDLSDPDVHRIIERFEDVTKEHYGVSVALKSVTDLGTLLENQDVIAESSIVAASVQTAEGQVTVPVAASAAWVRRGTQILRLESWVPFQSAESITTANKTIIDWVHSLKLEPKVTGDDPFAQFPKGIAPSPQTQAASPAPLGSGKGQPAYFDDIPDGFGAPKSDPRLPVRCRMLRNDQNVQAGCALFEGKLAEADRAREEEACRRKGAIRCWWSSLWGD